MNKLGIVFRESASSKRYYLVEKNYNQEDNLFIRRKCD